MKMAKVKLIIQNSIRAATYRPFSVGKVIKTAQKKPRQSPEIGCRG